MIPLIWNYTAAAPLVQQGSGPLSQSRFLARAQALAQRLPEASYAINHCETRDGFLLAFAAALLRGQTNLLPPSAAPGALTDLIARYPDSYVLAESRLPLCGTPSILVNPADDAGEWSGEVPQIAGDHRAALVFTSGSTGAAQPHFKLWRTFFGTAQQAAQRFLNGAQAQIAATVPPQHMYGLETTALMALCAGCVMHHGKPFYPADVREALSALKAPRVLVTTPVHIRALLAADVELPPLQLILCATAPLSAELAARAEEKFAAPLHEIYGFTEAGSIASRRTIARRNWEMYPGLSLREGRVFGPHLPLPVPLSDAVETDGDTRFSLLGRPDDMLKVAGKRASLQDLTLKLLDVPGVRDGVVFLPDAAERPAALVVGEATEPDILAALAASMDAVFLPRPLKKVERLPRNETGKLPRAALMRAFLACHSERSEESGKRTGPDSSLRSE